MLVSSLQNSKFGTRVKLSNERAREELPSSEPHEPEISRILTSVFVNKIELFTNINTIEKLYFIVVNLLSKDKASYSYCE